MGFFIGFCAHKWGKVQEDGFQYCSKCGKAKLAPQRSDGKCQHVWEKVDSYKTTDASGNNVKKITLLYECEDCGEPRQETIVP